jgi:type II secretory pathway pseudopilin PulG
MASAEETPWSVAVRVLAVVSSVLLIVVVLEGRTVRRARAELQQLRTERDQSQVAAMSAWARQPVSETGDALRWLDTFYAEPTEGFGRRGGLCADGRLADRPITAYLVGEFLTARGTGKSYEASIGAMRAAMNKSDEYRSVHPELATQAPDR